ncbi:MAG: hypothetical protein QT05_C0052G0016 [archaeon GW2011_AR13]|nr:MAG: hypothetical protein QT05_C0052G0016 [archaeon GW2011_AR13]HIG94250.1 hypothetical protein [Nanoarchaeota archaeon]HIH63149.1 hypothetical protein [Nanoarchaeota archaeon]HIJ10222.1 hypothetical protein [Nanoarchaeota archaeon]
MNKNECPKCGNPKTPWFSLCFDCNKKEKEKPVCDTCGVEVPEGHNLCKIHWIEKKNDEKKIQQIDYVKKQKEDTYREKYEGKYHSPFGKVKSMSELLIAYFLHLNQLNVTYEMKMQIGDQILRPDFAINDGKGNTILLEHFGSLNSNEDFKIPLYVKFCKENPNCFFVCTREKDIYNLKDNLGTKLNDAPLKRAFWN